MHVLRQATIGFALVEVALAPGERLEQCHGHLRGCLDEHQLPLGGSPHQVRAEGEKGSARWRFRPLALNLRDRCHVQRETEEPERGSDIGHRVVLGENRQTIHN